MYWLLDASVLGPNRLWSTPTAATNHHHLTACRRRRRILAAVVWLIASPVWRREQFLATETCSGGSAASEYGRGLS